jgi:hypothetical protein
MNFNDIGWLVAFALAGLTLIQLVQTWAHRRFTAVHERIDGGDKWFNEEMKALRDMVHRCNENIYAEIDRVEARIDACTPSDKKDKNYYNTDAGCCKSKQFVQD